MDYIITTIRAGGDAGRLFDEQTCLAHGVLGQETTGAGGFAMAIRSVPTLVYYCTLAREVANPGHLIFNFTNPSGIITQALRSKGFDNVYGICDAPSGFIKQLEEILEIPYGTLDIECYGLNHLSWFRNAKVNGPGRAAGSCWTIPGPMSIRRCGSLPGRWPGSAETACSTSICTSTTGG